MKKTLTVLLVLLFAFSFAYASGAAEQSSSAQAAAPMTHDELVAAAKAEGKLVFYNFSSRGPAAAFKEAYGIDVEVEQLGDTVMPTRVATEAGTGHGADVIFAQNSARVYPELIQTGLVLDYTPESLEGKMGAQYYHPLVFDLNQKVFFFNNEKGGSDITNVWQLTEAQWKGRVQFKSALNEAVNLNFFTMLTNPEWSAKLEQAYKKLYNKDIEYTQPNKNAGYEFIKRLHANAVFGSSDTKVAEAVGAKGQPEQLYGLFTLNKLRTAADKNLALEVNYNIEPFIGFMYPIYALITADAAHPNAAKLFLEFAYTKEGWAQMDVLGDFSPLLGSTPDPISLAQWEQMLVVEDPAWVSVHQAEVSDFIASL